MNAIESSQEMQVKNDVRDVCMPIGLVYEALVKAGRLDGRQGKKRKDQGSRCFYQYHGRTTDHSIQECQEFLDLVQEMMNEGEMEFYGKIKEQNVSVLQREVPKPIPSSIEGRSASVKKNASFSYP